jgi:hypothetical protein
VADGIPARVDKLRALGNAIVQDPPPLSSAQPCIASELQHEC